MQRVAAMSVVVRADGVSEALYNGQRDRVVEAVRKEAETRIKAAKQEADMERERAEFQRQNCNRLRKANMAALKANAARKPGAMCCAKNAVAVGWACVWVAAKAIKDTAVMCWAYFWGFLYAWKLVEYDWEGTNENHRR